MLPLFGRKSKGFWPVFRNRKNLSLFGSPKRSAAKIQVKEEAVADNQIKVEAVKPNISRLSADAAEFYPNFGIANIVEVQNEEIPVKEVKDPKLKEAKMEKLLQKQKLKEKWTLKP